MSTTDSILDRFGAVAAGVALTALAVALLSGALLLACMAYSTVDCEFNPKSERCIALDEREPF